ncbi:molybdate ABC transporter substrate-binding protein [Cytobacillus dafuensis]|uniref:Molybdate ABC transporter substrate-binding protein n=1 Tax=Cytobacillus dafuensis TaxID=1742359 RepID=A0A5B8Z4K3_CYTDA|nr:molybdate ABC transporter substrate-binding protein [Cytobacillus dafuensis]QED47861.1 molybdate ABC transporter substrate-binding protein [Cytobacillus dafuensis]
MKTRFSIIFTLICMIILGGCSTDKPASQPDSNTDKQQESSTESSETIELTISAAASLEDTFNEIKPIFEKEHKNIKLLFNFGGSGALQKQIIQGAPVDMFFSAAEDKYDELVTQGIIAENQGMDMLKNTLVLIIPKDAKNSIEGFQNLADLGDGKLALGTPEAVPAGNYGKQTLEHLGLWDKVQDNIVFAKDVRQVLTYVETGNVAAGLVYKTDALTSDKVTVVSEADPESHDPIVYPVGIIKATKHMDEAELFYQFLQEDDSKDIFEKYGFTVLE